jgi:hypothetical protein
MADQDLLAEAEKALEEARKAKAELRRRIEATRCAGAKVLIALEELEGIRECADAENAN